MKLHAAVLLLTLLNVILCTAYARIIPKPLSATRSTLSIRAGELGASNELSSLDWRYFAAGGMCAAFSHGITTPIGNISSGCFSNTDHHY